MDASFTRGMDEPLEDAYDPTSALFDSRNPTVDEKATLCFSLSVGFLHHHSQSEVSFAQALMSKDRRSGWAVCSPG